MEGFGYNLVSKPICGNYEHYLAKKIEREGSVALFWSRARAIEDLKFYTSCTLMWEGSHVTPV